MGKPICILLLDPDDESEREYQELCAKRGWQLYQARSFIEARELLPKRSYNVAIIEMMHTDFVAEDAWHYIRTWSPDILGIITTTSRSLHETVKVSEPGIISFLLKPYDKELMADLITQALETQAALRQVHQVTKQLSGLSTLLARVARAADGKVTNFIVAQIPDLLNSDGIRAYLVNPDKTRTSNSAENHVGASQDKTSPEIRFLDELIAEAMETSGPVVYGIPAESDYASLLNNRNQVDLQSAVVVPLVGTNRTYGVLTVTSRGQAERSLTRLDTQFVKILGQSMALMFDFIEKPTLEVAAGIHES
jgi:FixJ family two-component response regulator